MTRSRPEGKASRKRRFDHKATVAVAKKTSNASDAPADAQRGRKIVWSGLPFKEVLSAPRHVIDHPFCIKDRGPRAADRHHERAPSYRVSGYFIKRTRDKIPAFRCRSSHRSVGFDHDPTRIRSARQMRADLLSLHVQPVSDRLFFDALVRRSSLSLVTSAAQLTRDAVIDFFRREAEDQS